MDENMTTDMSYMMIKIALGCFVIMIFGTVFLYIYAQAYRPKWMGYK
jgi:hypothetical protein